MFIHPLSCRVFEHGCYDKIKNKMQDIFDNHILCKNCDVRMQKVRYIKNGYSFRAVKCGVCGNKLIHPEDKQEYKQYLNLKNKQFNVKLRMVGNSYTVSIPREIVNFINDQNKIVDELVSLSFDKMGKLSLNFNEENERRNC